jgi:hypothetical protein
VARHCVWCYGLIQVCRRIQSCLERWDAPLLRCVRLSPRVHACVFIRPCSLVAVGQDVSLQVLTQGSNDTSTFFSVDLPVGTAFRAGVKDSTGAVQFTAPVTVASASGTSASAVASLSASGTGDAAPVNTVAA